MSEFDDPFNLHPQSRLSGQREDGREVRFVGRPILSLNPATNEMLTIADFRDHPLIAGWHFYTLPSGLIDALVAKVGEASFDSQLLAMERRLSSFSGDHSSRVGLWQDLPIEYQQLRVVSLPMPSEEDLASLGWNLLEVRNGLRVFEERDETALIRFRRGYVGWLLTNRQFVDEHDALLAEHAETVRRWGTHRAGIVIPGGMRQPGTDPNEDPQWFAFSAAAEVFFGRWRLQGLAGPYLPNPLQPLMSGSFLISTLQQFDACWWSLLPA